MKYFKKSLLILLVVIAILIVGTALYLQYTKPNYSGKLKLQGLKDKVEVIYDEYGIPHIYAQNEHDLYYAFGYVHAQDRLFQMELILRVASGRLSELFGKETIAADRFFRSLGINKHAEWSAKEFESSKNTTAKIAATAYLDGINAFIRTGTTPVEYVLSGIPKDTFSTKDLFLITGYMSFSFAAAFKTDPLFTRIEAKLGGEYTKDLVTSYVAGSEKIPSEKRKRLRKKDLNLALLSINSIIETLPIPLLQGSNSWVIAPTKSSSGRVILANDTHIGYAQPSVWYEAHLECPGYSFYGNHLAGFPFAPLGHTRKIAWGLTMLENDDIDFYREKVNPENKNQVWAIDHWEEMKTRREVIEVKGSSEIILDVKETRHGPIMNQGMKELDESEKNPVSMFWTHLKFPSNLLEATYGLSHSQTISEFIPWVSKIAAPGLNIMYGDSVGNIGWWAGAKQIKRKPGVNPVHILDGASGKDDPIGFYTFEENARSVNPSKGYVYSANNQPDANGTSLMPGYYLIDDRAKRIVSYLNEFKTFSADDFRKIQFDMISPLSLSTTTILIQAIEEAIAKNGTENEKKAIQILKVWNGDHQLNDIAPVIYTKILYHILENTFADELGMEEFKNLNQTLILKSSQETLFRNTKSIWWDNIQTKSKEDRQIIFIKSFQSAIEDLQKQLGMDVTKWRWRDVHTVEYAHPLGKLKPLHLLLNVGPFPAPSGNDVLNVSGFTLNSSGYYKANHGPAMRLVIDFADIEHATSILPTGQSGNCMSPFYQDQAKMYLNGESRLMMMNKKEIEDGAFGRLVMEPGE